jgi:NAD(P)H-flavin reductase
MEDTPITLEIVEIKPQTPDIALFTMRGGAGLDAPALPGQVAILQVGGGPTGYFACAHAPHEEDWQFLVKRGGGASGEIMSLDVGGEVRLQKIVGRGFDVEPHKGRDLLFVAMGTGVAPLRSALRAILRERESYGRLVFLYGARTPADFCFTEEFHAANDAGVELRTALTRPMDSDSRLAGYVQTLLDKALTDLPRPVALICGSSAMMEDTRARLSAHAHAPQVILSNY